MGESVRAVVCGPALGLPPYAVVSWLNANNSVSAKRRRDSRRYRRDMVFRNRCLSGRRLFGRLLSRLTIRDLLRPRRSQPPEERESR